MAGRKGVTDFFSKEAKRLGFVARSSFKLQEMQTKFGVIKKGGRGLHSSTSQLNLSRV
jgi:23S rRNA U2552 (ribose-2'-O)-methylase RlmE/FtsJ